MTRKEVDILNDNKIIGYGQLEDIVYMNGKIYNRDSSIDSFKLLSKEIAKSLKKKGYETNKKEVYNYLVKENYTYPDGQENSIINDWKVNDESFYKTILYYYEDKKKNPLKDIIKTLKKDLKEAGRYEEPEKEIDR